MKELFRDGNWRLIVSSSPPHSYPASCTDIQHRCGQRHASVTTNWGWWYYCGYEACGVCEAPIPEEMRGLKRLQDWDR